MSEGTYNPAAGTPVHLTLSFHGIARYSVYDFRKAEAGWNTTPIEKDGSSEDFRADIFDLDPFRADQPCVLLVNANMTSPKVEDDVDVTCTLSQDGSSQCTFTESGKIQKGGSISLPIRIEVKAL